MRLLIRHETIYRYSTPVRYSIQVLRLTPRVEPHQTIASWQVQAPARTTRSEDAYGNTSHLLAVVGQHREIRVLAHGVVDVSAPSEPGRVPPSPLDRLSPFVFLCPTALTEVTPDIARFAARHLREGPHSPQDFVGLAAAIERAVMYRSGITDVSSPAIDALEAGYGVCQDHAHLFIACCRVRGVPARYVSGYVDPGDLAHAATHAWVDVWIDGRGWYSVDVTGTRLIGDRHCRLAVGRDYESASPLRGVRFGGGEESMDVDVQVAPQ